MQNRLLKNSSPVGYTLVELLVVIIIMGVIASIAVNSLKVTDDTMKIEQTKQELNQLAWAIAGKPDLLSGGYRTDYGYVGDVGALPPNLNALVNNPGLATWQGPYIRDDYYLKDTSSAYESLIDAWGKSYTYGGGVTITSTGSGTALTRTIANSVGDLLYNTIAVVVLDIDDSPPGADYQDSVQVQLTYPNGAGALTTTTQFPNANGYVSFDSIPIGHHRMQVVYLPDNDTLVREVYVNPGQTSNVTIHFFANVW